jgi:protein phosphatase
LGLLLPLIGLLLVVAGAAYAGYHWTQNQYYVGVDSGQVAIFRGVPQQVVGRSLSHVLEPSGVQASTLPTFAQSQVKDTIAAGSLDEARRIVQHLRTQSDACTSDVELAGCPEPSSSPTTTAGATASPGATTSPSTSGSPTVGTTP